MVRFDLSLFKVCLMLHAHQCVDIWYTFHEKTIKSARDELTNKGDIIVLAATAFIVRTQAQFTFSFPWCFNNERG